MADNRRPSDRPTGGGNQPSQAQRTPQGQRTPQTPRTPQGQQVRRTSNGPVRPQNQRPQQANPANRPSGQRPAGQPQRPPQQRTAQPQRRPDSNPPVSRNQTARKPRQPAPRDRQAQRPPQRPAQQPPVRRNESFNREADRAARSAMNNKAAPVKKRRRGGDYRYFWLLFFGLAAVVFVVLANTVLFSVEEIEVVGSVRYTAEEVIGASGLSVGDNLLRVKKDEAAKAVVSSLNFIDTAKVEKVFPTKLRITVGEAEKWFAVCENGETAAISRNGRIIDDADGSLVRVHGYEAASLEPGGWLVSLVDGKNGIPEEILTAADKLGFDKITDIDITDRFAITASCGSVTLELGNISEIETKLSIAKTLIEKEIAPGAQVIIRLDDPEKAAVKPVGSESAVLGQHPRETAESREGTAESREGTAEAVTSQ